MQLIEDAKKVLLQAWSVRLSALAAVAGALAQFQDQLPAIQPYLPSKYLGAISITCAVAATAARLIKQESMHE